ncbi:MAG TPA: threonine--tRNA ligase [Candidatus Paceibacterota bacterium]
MEERDHRVLGKELDLFTFSDLVGSGLPLWTPKGTIVRQELDNFIWEMRKAHGFERVTIPHITKKDLYEKSGHWQKFADELFKITSREGREYAMKPMNCPHHTQIFDRKPMSYREMPQRYAETTMVYRDEQSGELGGLTRVLSITQDDAHIFCRTSQVREEFNKVWDIIDRFYKTFGFTLRVRLSFRDPAAPEKYLGTPEIWDKAEGELRSIAEERGADYFEGPGEAALYGPKLDFMATNAAGREWQVATIQLDMNIPERFDLTCVNEKGEKERIVMIHCAIAGSLERAVAVLLEHYAGALPLWLSPVQVAILPVGEAHKAYAEKVASELAAHNIRVEILADDSLGKRIREAKTKKIPATIVVGDKEAADNLVAIENNRDGKKMTESVTNAIDWLTSQIKERTNI